MLVVSINDSNFSYNHACMDTPARTVYKKQATCIYIAMAIAMYEILCNDVAN